MRFAKQLYKWACPAVVAVVLGGSAALAPRPVAAAPAIPAASALSACRTRGWVRIGGLASGYVVTSLGGAASLQRVYAGFGGTTPPHPVPPDRRYAYSGWLSDANWPGLGDFTDVPVSDFLATPDQPEARMWASGAGNRPVTVAHLGDPRVFSPHGGLTWVTQLATAEGRVYAASSQPKGIHRWNDAGQQWDAVGGSDIGTRAFWAFEAGGGRLWVGTDGRGPWSSADGGATWSQAESGSAVQLATVTALAIDPFNPDRVAIGLGPQVDETTPPSQSRGLRISADAGQSWSAPAFQWVDFVAGIAFSQRTRDTLFAATLGHGVYASRDGGRTWRSATPPGWEHQGRIYALLTLVPPEPAGCELLFAGGHGGVWVRDIGADEPRVYLPLAARDAAIPQTWSRSDAPADGQIAAAPFGGPTPAAVRPELP